MWQRKLKQHGHNAPPLRTAAGCLHALPRTEREYHVNEHTLKCAKYARAYKETSWTSC